MFQECFKEVLGVFQETFKGDSRELQGIEKNFKGCFKAVSKMF